MATPNFSRRVLNIGFLAALTLAAVAFMMTGWYLKRFAEGSENVVSLVLNSAKSGAPMSASSMELLQNALGVQSYIARVLLVSCGMFIALSFGFLGFALFLVGAAGASDVAASSGTGFNLSLTAIAPGTIAILAAAILAGVCVTRPLAANIELGGSQARRPPAASDALDDDDPLRTMNTSHAGETSRVSSASAKASAPLKEQEK